MQTSHTTLDLSGVHLLDSTAERCLDKNAAEKTDHTRRVQKRVALSGWHKIFNASGKVIPPRSVLV